MSNQTESKLQPIGLADAIDNLRQELELAEKRAEGNDLRFRVDEIEVELGVEIDRQISAGGKISFKVFGTGAELVGGGDLGRSAAHRIKLVLKPTRKGEPFEVLDPSKQRPK